MLFWFYSWNPSFLQSNFDSRASVCLRKELIRVYENEKVWREQLWKNGILRSSTMSPRKRPEHVGSEEVSL